MIRRLKSCVVQEEEFGCVIANIATVLGLNYKEIRKWFTTDFSKDGISCLAAAKFLDGYNLDMNWCETINFTGYRDQKQRLLKPIADIHIISVKEHIDSKNGHSIIMDGIGKIFCPCNGKGYEIKEALFINGVLAIWYPKNFKLGKAAGLK